ncbi:hypothetical protein BC830DRAFT_1136922 [Chytriomyces sp. MP71]|nr:hypothetical protein BC830DRAFT_1136922 [Chytriomyces sp. MP71]
MIPRVNLIFLGFPSSQSSDNSTPIASVEDLSVQKSAGASRRVTLELNTSNMPQTIYDIILRASRRNLSSDTAVSQCLNYVRKGTSKWGLTVYSSAPDFSLMSINSDSNLLRDEETLLVVWSPLHLFQEFRDEVKPIESTCFTKTEVLTQATSFSEGKAEIGRPISVSGKQAMKPTPPTSKPPSKLFNSQSQSPPASPKEIGEVTQSTYKEPSEPPPWWPQGRPPLSSTIPQSEARGLHVSPVLSMLQQVSSSPVAQSLFQHAIHETLGKSSNPNGSASEQSSELQILANGLLNQVLEASSKSQLSMPQNDAHGVHASPIFNMLQQVSSSPVAQSLLQQAIHASNSGRAGEQTSQLLTNNILSQLLEVPSKPQPSMPPAESQGVPVSPVLSLLQQVSSSPIGQSLLQQAIYEALGKSSKQSFADKQSLQQVLANSILTHIATGPEKVHQQNVESNAGFLNNKEKGATENDKSVQQHSHSHGHLPSNEKLNSFELKCLKEDSDCKAAAVDYFSRLYHLQGSKARYKAGSSGVSKTFKSTVLEAPSRKHSASEPPSSKPLESASRRSGRSQPKWQESSPSSASDSDQDRATVPTGLSNLLSNGKTQIAAALPAFARNGSPASEPRTDDKTNDHLSNYQRTRSKLQVTGSGIMQAPDMKKTDNVGSTSKKFSESKNNSDSEQSLNSEEEAIAAMDGETGMPAKQDNATKLARPRRPLGKSSMESDIEEKPKLPSKLYKSNSSSKKVIERTGIHSAQESESESDARPKSLKSHPSRSKVSSAEKDKRWK